jgi:hypothetical protein
VSSSPQGPLLRSKQEGKATPQTRRKRPTMQANSARSRANIHIAAARTPADRMQCRERPTHGAGFTCREQGRDPRDKVSLLKEGTARIRLDVVIRGRDGLTNERRQAFVSHSCSPTARTYAKDVKIVGAEIFPPSLLKQWVGGPMDPWACVSFYWVTTEPHFTSLFCASEPARGWGHQSVDMCFHWVTQP